LPRMRVPVPAHSPNLAMPQLAEHSLQRDTMVPTMADVVRVVAADDPLRALFSPAGELTAQGRSRLGLDAAGLRELYRNMVLIRRADQEALNLQRQGGL